VALLLRVDPVPLFPPCLAAEQQPAVSERVVLDGTAKVDRIDISTRSITVRSAANQLFSVYVDPQVQVFRELKVGDTIRIRIVDAVVVAVVPNARLTVPTDTTADARRNRAAADPEVMQQLKMVVTIESVDAVKQTVTYKAADNRSVTRYAVDPHLLEGLKRGDIVELTYTRQRAVELARP